MYQNQYRDKFIAEEQKLGINRDHYQMKFIYSAKQGSDNYLIDRYTATPSQLQGFSIQQEKCIGELMSQLTFRAAESLRLPVSTAVVSASISHFYYSRVGFLNQDFRDIIMGSMFLACKSEQTLRRSYQISAVFDHVFKIFEGTKMPIKSFNLNSTEYNYMKNKVLDSEKKILFELGFQIYRLLDIPHRYIGGLLKSFEKHKQSQKICQTAWTHLNDFYRTNVCLYYPGQIIAAAAVYSSLLKLNIKMPTVPWWILMEANLESIQELTGELQYFYQMSKQSRYTMQWVSNQITEVAQKHQLKNVFPLTYNKKIMLDLNGELRISNVQLLPEIQAQIIKHAQEMVPQIVQNDSSSREYEKKKSKKEKKNKKDKKKRKDKERSRDGKDSSDSQSVILKEQKNREFSPVYKRTPLYLPVQPNLNVETCQEPEKGTVRELQIETTQDLKQKIRKQLKERKNIQIKSEARKEEDSDQDSQDLQILAELKRKKKLNTKKNL